MKPALGLLIFSFLATRGFCLATASHHETATNRFSVEKIICVRHGEKPADGLGQLTCKGLNRALALPGVLLQKYGRPQYIFAPATTQKADGKKHDKKYSYVRPLATIEPTAIRCGLPVNTQFSYEDIKDLKRELQKDAYQDATVFISWEHSALDDLVKDLMRNYGGKEKVPDWDAKDYDSIFVVEISTSPQGAKTIHFLKDQEGLNNVNDTCP